MTHERLKFAREQAGFRFAADAAQAMGVSYSTYSSHENGEKGLSRAGPRYAKFFRVSLEWLLMGEGEMQPEQRPVNANSLIAAPPPAGATDSPQDLPILGTAAAAIIGAVTLGQAIGYLRRPPGLLSTPDAYALYVAGDSMEPRYRSGDVVYVNPHRPCRQGDDVVIQTRIRPGDDIAGYVKTLVSRSPREVVARQYNPPSTIEYRAPTVIAVHRVLSAHELMQG